MNASPPLYSVGTWCCETEAFTPQIGLPPGPFLRWQLRGVLRTLRRLGYEGRRGDSYVLVQRVDGAVIGSNA